MKNHLKRIAAPQTWVLDRRERTFTVKPNPGAHKEEMCLPLGIILRDVLGLAGTMNEVRKIINTQEVLIDGKRRKDHHFGVGLFDVLSLVALAKFYRVLLDTKGRLIVCEISGSEVSEKVCRIVAKHVISGGQIQYTLHDGKNVRGDFTARVGDSVVLDVATSRVKEVLALAQGCCVYLVDGKHAGSVGTLKELGEKDVVVHLENNEEVSTARSCVFVVGKKVSFMNLGLSKK